MKRFFCFVVVLAVMLSVLCVPVAAAEDAVTLVVRANTTSAQAGDLVTYTISVNNPTGTGIAGLSFSVQMPDGMQYVEHTIKCTGSGLFMDESELKQSAAYQALDGSTDGLTLPLVQYNDGVARFDGAVTSDESGITKSTWTVMTLTCKAVSATSDLELTLSDVSLYSADTSGNTSNLESTEKFEFFGDTTGDGKVNGQDLIRLRKYLAGADVAISANGADATGDGKVNGQDLIRLRRYLAGAAQLG